MTDYMMGEAPIQNLPWDNNSGYQVLSGSVVVPDKTAAKAGKFTLPAGAGVACMLGVLNFTCKDQYQGNIITAGEAEVVAYNAIAIGDYLEIAAIELVTNINNETGYQVYLSSIPIGSTPHGTYNCVGMAISPAVAKNDRLIMNIYPNSNQVIVA